MKFVEVEEAKKMPGMRLVVSRGQWALWSEFAKSIFYIKKIPYVAVAQAGFQENPELVAWTGVRNQPQAIYNDEPVRAGWLDILNLAERIAPKPRLLPQESAQRATVVGLSNEICGEWGIGWCRRIQIAAQHSFGPEGTKIMQRNYGQKDADASAAEARCADIIGALGKRLHEQEKIGSRYFVGDSLTAIDVYWACVSNLVKPLPADLCPMDPNIRAAFDNPGPEIGAVLDPILFSHRDHVYRTYLQLPVDFG